MIDAPFTSSGDDLQDVVHMRRLLKRNIHVTHDEGKARRFLLGLLEHGAMIGAQQAQVVGAAALHEAQIAGVIDDAGKIGVLVIHPHVLAVQTVAENAVDGVGVVAHE
jgi:uncharacterized protein YfeS